VAAPALGSHAPRRRAHAPARAGHAAQGPGARAGGAGALAEVEDARGALSAAAGSALPGGAAVQLGCMYSVEADQLWLAAGSAAGAAARVCLWDAAGAAEPRAAVPRAKKHHGLGKRQRAV